MYLDYWRLREEPFTNALDPRFLLTTPQHSEGIARLLYAARQKKEGAVLTGGYGTGKSLVRTLFISKLQHVGNFSVALVENPLADPETILKDIYEQMAGRQVAASQSGSGVFRALSALFSEKQAHGFHNLIVVEEAQLLSSPERLEQLRLLMNLTDASGRCMVTMVFVGQLDVMDIFARSPGLMQRLSTRWNLDPLTAAQARDYISHRLIVAGGNGWIFDEGAVNVLHAYSEGTARIINNACDMALYLGMSENAVRVDAEIATRVVADLQGGTAVPQEAAG
ncbi:MAG TPA: hypothetical protein DCS43_15865 [Verrucomicrobia bacterium]|nr:hypothetical protein [Verrucomicrobiota bacterium]